MDFGTNAFLLSAFGSLGDFNAGDNQSTHFAGDANGSQAAARRRELGPEVYIYEVSLWQWGAVGA